MLREPSRVCCKPFCLARKSEEGCGACPSVLACWHVSTCQQVRGVTDCTPTFLRLLGDRGAKSKMVIDPQSTHS